MNLKTKNVVMSVFPQENIGIFSFSSVKMYQYHIFYKKI